MRNKNFHTPERQYCSRIRRWPCKNLRTLFPIRIRASPVFDSKTKSTESKKVGNPIKKNHGSTLGILRGQLWFDILCYSLCMHAYQIAGEKTHPGSSVCLKISDLRQFGIVCKKRASIRACHVFLPSLRVITNWSFLHCWESAIIICVSCAE